jgi:hypothetical protein
MWALVAAQKPADEGPPAWVRRPRFGALPEGRIVVAEEALAQSAVVGRGGGSPPCGEGLTRHSSRVPLAAHCIPEPAERPGGAQCRARPRRGRPDM